MKTKFSVIFFALFLAFSEALGQADVQAGAINTISNFAGEEIVLQSSDYVFETRYGKVRVKMSLQNGESHARLTLTPPLEGELGSMSNQASSLVSSLASSTKGENSTIVEAISAIIQNTVTGKDGSEGDVTLDVAMKNVENGTDVKFEFKADDTVVNAELTVKDNGEGKSEVSGETNVNGTSSKVNINVISSGDGASANGTIGGISVSTDNSAKEEKTELKSGTTTIEKSDGSKESTSFKDNGDGTTVSITTKTDKDGNPLEGGTTVEVIVDKQEGTQDSTQSGDSDTLPDDTLVSVDPKDYSKRNISGQDFSNKNLSGYNFSNAIAIGTNFENSKLNNANLSSANFSSANLQNADLSGANLNSTNLDTAKLSGADFSTADLSSSTLTSTNLNGANFSGANLSSANLGASNLNAVKFGGANLSSANLGATTLSGADFTGANLKDTSFDDATISGATLSGVTPNGFTREQLYSTSDYKNGVITDVDMSNNDIGAWTFSGKTIENADFSNTNIYRKNGTTGLTFANGSKLTNLDFSNSNVYIESDSGAVLSGFFSRSELNNVNFDNSGFCAINPREAYAFTAGGATLNNVSAKNSNFVSQVALDENVDTSQFVSSRAFTLRDANNGATINGLDISGSYLTVILQNAHKGSAGGVDISDSNVTNFIAKDLVIYSETSGNSTDETISAYGIHAYYIDINKGSAFDISGTSITANTVNSGVGKTVTYGININQATGGSVNLADTTYDISAEGVGEINAYGISGTDINLESDVLLDASNTNISVIGKSSGIGYKTRVLGANFYPCDITNIDFSNSTYNVTGEGNGILDIDALLLASATTDINLNIDNSSFTANAKNSGVNKTDTTEVISTNFGTISGKVNVTNSDFIATAEGNGGDMTVFSFDAIRFGDNANFSNNNFYASAKGSGYVTIRNINSLQLNNADFSKNTYTIDVDIKDGELALSSYTFWGITLSGYLDFSESKYDVDVISENSQVRIVASQFGKATIQGDLDMSKSEYDIKAVSKNNSASATVLQITTNASADNLYINNSTVKADIKSTGTLYFRGISESGSQSKFNSIDARGLDFNVTTESDVSASNVSIVNGLSGEIGDLNFSDSNFVVNSTGSTTLFKGITATSLTSDNANYSGSTYQVKSISNNGTSNSTGVEFKNSNVTNINATASNYLFETTASTGTTFYGVLSENLISNSMDLSGSTYDIKSTSASSNSAIYGLSFNEAAISSSTAGVLQIDNLDASGSNYTLNATGNHADAYAVYMNSLTADKVNLNASTYDIINTTATSGSNAYGVRIINDSSVKNLDASNSSYTIDANAYTTANTYGFYSQNLTSSTLKLNDSAYDIKARATTGSTYQTLAVCLSAKAADSSSTPVTKIDNIDARGSTYVIDTESQAQTRGYGFYGEYLLSEKVDLSGSEYNLRAKSNSESNYVYVKGARIDGSVKEIDASNSTYIVEGIGNGLVASHGFQTQPITSDFLNLSGSVYDIKSNSITETEYVTSHGVSLNQGSSIKEIDAKNSNYTIEAVSNSNTLSYGLQTADSFVSTLLDLSGSIYNVRTESGLNRARAYGISFGGVSKIIDNINASNSNYTIVAQGGTSSEVYGVDASSAVPKSLNTSGSTYDIKSTSTSKSTAYGLYLNSSVGTVDNVDASGSTYILETPSGSSSNSTSGVYTKGLSIQAIDLSDSSYEIKSNCAKAVVLDSFSTESTIDKIDLSNSNYQIISTDSTAGTIASGVDISGDILLNTLNLSGSTYNLKSNNSLERAYANGVSLMASPSIPSASVQRIVNIDASNSNYTIDASSKNNVYNTRGFIALNLDSDYLNISNSTYDMKLTSDSGNVNAQGVNLLTSLPSDSTTKLEIDTIDASNSTYTLDAKGNGEKDTFVRTTALSFSDINLTDFYAKDSSYTVIANNGYSTTAAEAISMSVNASGTVDLSGSEYNVKADNSNIALDYSVGYSKAVGLNGAFNNINASNSNYTVETAIKGGGNSYGFSATGISANSVNLSGSTYNIKGNGDTTLGAWLSGAITNIDVSGSTYTVEASGDFSRIATGFDYSDVTGEVLNLSNSTYNIKSIKSNDKSGNGSFAIGVLSNDAKVDKIDASNSIYTIELESEAQNTVTGTAFRAYNLNSNSVNLSGSIYVMKNNSPSGSVDSAGVCLTNSFINNIDVSNSKFFIEAIGASSENKVYGFYAENTTLQNANFQNTYFEIINNGVDVTATNAVYLNGTTLINADFRGSNVSNYCVNTAASLTNVIYADGSMSGLSVNGSDMTIRAYSPQVTRSRALMSRAGSISAKLSNSNAIIKNGTLTLEQGAALEILNGNSFTLGEGGIVKFEIDPFNVFTPLMFDGNSTFILDGGVMIIDINQGITSDRLFTLISWSGGCNMSDLETLLNTASIRLTYQNKAYTGNWRVSINANDNTLNVFLGAIPEPAEYAAIMGLIALALATYYKRRK